MNLSSTKFSPHEDRDSEVFNADEFPWDESWEEPALLFESLESRMIQKSLPSREELLALDTMDPHGGEADTEEADLELWDDFASGEY